MSWLFDVVKPPTQGGGGLFGWGAPQQDGVNRLQILGAMLQDLAQNYQGKPGGALTGINQEMRRLGDKKQYQDMVKSAIGAESPNMVMSTPSVFEPGRLPQVQAAKANDAQSMMFSGPLGQQLPYEQAASLAATLPNLSPEVGTPLMFNTYNSAIDRKDRRAEREEDFRRQAETPKYQVVDGALYQIPTTPGGSPTVVIPGRKKPPETRTYRSGTTDVTEELQEDGTWKVIGRGAAFKPDAPGGGNQGSWSQPVDETGPDGQPIRVRYNTNGGRQVVIGAAPAAGKSANVDEAKNKQIYDLVSKQLPIALNNYDDISGFNMAGSNAAKLWNALPLGEGLEINPASMMGEKGRSAANAIKDIATNFTYSVSGATAPPQEVQDKIDLVMPKATDSAKVREEKKARLKSWVDSIGSRTGGAARPSPSGAAAGTGGDVSAALAWAKEHPTDPRAAEIMKRLGAR